MDIKEISDATKKEIEKKSVLALGDTVTGKPDVVKRAMYEPVGITVREINRIVAEANRQASAKIDRTEINKADDDAGSGLMSKSVIMAEINRAVSQLKIALYPVGAIFISVNDINPSSFIGGTWEKITGDAYLKIVGSDAGRYGGTASDHKIPLSSMPSHTHTLKELRVWGGDALRIDGAFPAATYPENSQARGYNMASQFADKFALHDVGGGQAYYPYYYGVYVYRRTA